MHGSGDRGCYHPGPPYHAITSARSLLFRSKLKTPSRLACLPSLLRAVHPRISRTSCRQQEIQNLGTHYPMGISDYFYADRKDSFRANSTYNHRNCRHSSHSQAENSFEGNDQRKDITAITVEFSTVIAVFTNTFCPISPYLSLSLIAINLAVFVE